MAIGGAGGGGGGRRRGPARNDDPDRRRHPRMRCAVVAEGARLVEREAERAAGGDLGRFEELVVRRDRVLVRAVVAPHDGRPGGDDEVIGLESPRRRVVGLRFGDPDLLLEVLDDRRPGDHDLADEVGVVGTVVGECAGQEEAVRPAGARRHGRRRERPVVGFDLVAAGDQRVVEWLLVDPRHGRPGRDLDPIGPGVEGDNVDGDVLGRRSVLRDGRGGLGGGRPMGTTTRANPSIDSRPKTTRRRRALPMGASREKRGRD